LHVVMCHDEQRDYRLFMASSMTKQPTVSDRLRWLLQTFKYQKNIFIHALDEKGIAPYPHGWQEWSDRVRNLLKDKGIVPSYVYSSEPQDVEPYKNHLQLETILIDPQRHFVDISATKIRENPLYYWDYIPTEVKPFFVRT